MKKNIINVFMGENIFLNNSKTEKDYNIFSKLLLRRIKSDYSGYNYTEEELFFIFEFTIEKCIGMKAKNSSRTYVGSKIVLKSIDYSQKALLAKKIKYGEVFESRDGDGKRTYTNNPYKVKIINSSELDITTDEGDTLNYIENLSSNDSKSSTDNLDIEIVLNMLEKRFDKQTKSIGHLILLEYKNREISDILNIKIKKIENERIKIRNYLKSLTELF